MSRPPSDRPDPDTIGDRPPHLVTPPPGPASKAMVARLERVESRNVTFSSEAFPVFWSEARGSNVRDADDNLYVDLTAAFGVAAAGHRHPRIGEAIEAQARSLVHGMGDVHPPVPKLELLERLCDIAPWPESRAVLASSGSEAVEIALKTAQLATGRAGAVAFEGGYHGLTLGALGVTEREDFRAPFRDRLTPTSSFVPFPHRTEGTDAVHRALAALEQALEGATGNGSRPGAVILEPIQGRGGVRIPPPGFLAEVAHRTRDAGAVLIVDEIFTGLGRAGTLFAIEDKGFVPDILCLGKALGGGLPLSCCVGSREVMEAWPPSRGEALHTSTFLGHPLACASAMAFLDIVEDEDLPARARESGERFLRTLATGLESSPHVGEVRGRGMLLGVELSLPDTSSGRRRPWAGGGAAAAVAALRRGLLTLPAGPRADVLQVTPPLTMPTELIDGSAKTLASVLRSLEPASTP